METAVMICCIVIVFAAGFFIMRRVDHMLDRERNGGKADEPDRSRKNGSAGRSRGRTEKNGKR